MLELLGTSTCPYTRELRRMDFVAFDWERAKASFQAVRPDKDLHA